MSILKLYIVIITIIIISSITTTMFLLELKLYYAYNHHYLVKSTPLTMILPKEQNINKFKGLWYNI
jgi:hypothetical protein